MTPEVPPQRPVTPRGRRYAALAALLAAIIAYCWIAGDWIPLWAGGAGGVAYSVAHDLVEIAKRRRQR
jgi:hypothetical protein